MTNNKILNPEKVHKENACNKVNIKVNLTASNYKLTWNSFFINGIQATDDFMTEVKKPAKK